MPYRPDLYRGTADHYERFRPPYPKDLLDDLCARVPVTGTGQLLDLACGTGQIAFPLAGAFSRVVAVDQEADAIKLAERKAQALGVGNIDWLLASAEQVRLSGRFQLVAIGNAFHRLDRERVARRLVPHIEPDGCVALLWSHPPWHGERPWQRELADTLGKWRREAGADDRVPEAWERAIAQDPHAEVLRRAGLAYAGRFEFDVSQQWTLASLAGFVYSTSFLNRTVLGERVKAFESDLRRRLVGPGGRDLFRQDSTCAYELARLAR